jgi:hypothetical protein
MTSEEAFENRFDITQLRKAVTALEMALMEPQEPIDIQRQCVLLMMKADAILKRFEGTEFAPDIFRPVNTLLAQ